MVGFPFPSTTDTTGASGEAMAVLYQGAPAKLTSAADTHYWIQRYFHVVFAGVMRYAALYLDDPVRYYTEKAVYENGIKDMLEHEEAPTAASPVRRGIDPEIVGRNM
jgi:hypothetical protein